MAYDDQFTAVGPPFAGSGFPRSGFSTSAAGMVYGLNVQGDRCGVYGESIRVDGDRESTNEGVGVHGFGENFGVVGNGNRGIAGVYGQNNRGRIGAIGAAMRGGTGVVGASLEDLGNPLATWQTIPSPSAGGSGTGVLGISRTGIGVQGQSETSTGILGQSTSGIGAQGQSETSTGILGQSTSGIGVQGQSETSTGILGQSTSGIGVQGQSETSTGILGRSTSGIAVLGRSNSDIGVSGFSNSGIGVFGSMGFGNDEARAASFRGPVDVGGHLEVYGTLHVNTGVKNFKIDHPLDPKNKYLLHTCVESSEMKNVYDGIAQLDEDGAAWVDLPKWFEALNGDFRYQLTAVGGAAPNLHVAAEIYENRFKIAGGERGMKVCWQVTGARKDPWAAANPFEVEQEKPERDQGRYLQPDLYGAPEEQRVIRTFASTGDAAGL